jgi:glycosyltransferase involved in cell wall biosynthesis
VISKILYVHYQRSKRDGSYVHTREFETAFRSLCEQRGTHFSVVAPPLVSPSFEPPGPLARMKRRLARFYLREIKTLLLQLGRALREWRMLRRKRPDIVLARFTGETLSILWACRWQRIPVVIEINAPDRTELGSEYRLLPGLSTLFSNRHALELADGAFTVSEQLTQPLKQQDREGKPVVTIPNGVDIARFSPGISGTEIRRSLDIPETAVVIGYVGSFAPWHGLDLLLTAFSEMLRRTARAHLLLVGQTSPQWQALLDRMSAPELSPHITLAGFVPPDRIPPCLAAMDIAVLPDSAYYCSPLKLFEYMAMARPIVAVATDPVAAMLKDGEEGLLFPRNDAGALARALSRLLDDESLRRRLGAAARLRVERDYTWRQNAERVYTLLEQAYRWTQTHRAPRTAPSMNRSR